MVEISFKTGSHNPRNDAVRRAAQEMPALADEMPWGFAIVAATQTWMYLTAQDGSVQSVVDGGRRHRH